MSAAQTGPSGCFHQEGCCGPEDPEDVDVVIADSIIT
jgi:hypothetical protein